MSHPINAVYVDGAANKPQKGAIRTYQQARAPLVLASAAEIQSLDVGATTAAVLSGRLYYYDSTDASSAHDGVNVLVDATGRRFKLPTALQVQSGIWRIQDKDLSAPPGSPAAGAAYIVAAGASGAWAGQSGKIALYVAGAWAFSTPLSGAQAWVVDEATYYHFNGSAWAAGLPGQIAGGSVRLSHLLNGAPLLVVESTANAPAGGESNGAAYIVGASPSGAFSTFGAKSIAIREAGAWVEYPPVAGWRVDQKSDSTMQRYTGSAWQNGAGGGKVVNYWVLSAPAQGLALAPSWTQLAAQAIAIATAGNKLLFDFSTELLTAASSVGISNRIRRDSEVSALKTQDAYPLIGPRLAYLLTPGDTASHTYRFEASKGSNVAMSVSAEIIIWELAA